MDYRRGCPDSGEELMTPLLGSIRTEDANEHGPIEVEIGRQPFLDVLVATQSHFEAIARRKRGRHYCLCREGAYLNSSSPPGTSLNPRPR